MVKTVGIERLTSIIASPDGAVQPSASLNKDSYLFRLLQRLHANVMGMSSSPGSASTTPQKATRPTAASSPNKGHQQSPPGSATKTTNTNAAPSSTPSKRPLGAGKIPRTPPPAATAATPAAATAAAATAAAATAAAATATAPAGSDGDLMARFARLKKKA